MSTDHDGWLRAALDAHGRELHAHCYRLAGNVADADDLVQETFLRAWKARDGFDGRASARTWLYRIATNVFLDTRKSAQQRSVPSGDIFEWCIELGPYPDSLLDDDPQAEHSSAELVELALIAALMHLPPRQRVAFVLRDIHGLTPAEVAEALDVSVVTANALLQRARETMRRHAPSDPGQWRRPRLTAADKELLRRYSEAKDFAAMRDLLAEDVRITMPPDEPVVGFDEASQFLTRPLDWYNVLVSANGRPAVACYLRRPGQPHYEALVVDVLGIADGKIQRIHAFVGAGHFTAFGLPPAIEVPQ